jgi:hypothetical protein
LAIKLAGPAGTGVEWIHVKSARESVGIRGVLEGIDTCAEV